MVYIFKFFIIMVLIPVFHKMIRPILELLADKELHRLKEVVNHLAAHFEISEEERLELTPVGKRGKFYIRVAWAISTLRNIGLLENTEIGVFKITKKGDQKRNILIRNPNMSGFNFLSQFPEYRNFLHRNRDTGSETQDSDGDELSPQELIDKNFLILETNLHDELLSEINDMDPYAFQRLVSTVLTAMRYGSPDLETDLPKTRDGGIDGIINQDELGLEKIYLQAKRWRTNRVSKDEIQKFMGALSDKATKKGVFITTSKFTRDAKDFAKSNANFSVVLIDGQKLAKLMDKYNLGVTNSKTYTIKKFDQDFFDEYNI